MRKEFSEYTLIDAPICKVPKRFDIIIRIRSEDGNRYVACSSMDNNKGCGTYQKIKYRRNIPRILTIYFLLREVLVETFLLIRGK